MGVILSISTIYTPAIIGIDEKNRAFTTSFNFMKYSPTEIPVKITAATTANMPVWKS